MTDHSDQKIKAKDDFIVKIIKCLCDAIGDDIKEDIKLNQLVTQNSTSSRIWDFINTNICKNFVESDIIANPTKRGGWELVPVFERSTGIIYSLMREQRFALLKKELAKRQNAHYVDALARSFNKNLIAPKPQIRLFPIFSSIKSFKNEERIRDIIQKILYDLSVPNELVKGHALILFDSYNNELSSIRCCMVDSNLDIVTQVGWSDYIKASESAIVDNITDKISKHVNPTVGLKYTQKAKDKIGQRNLTDKKDNNQKSNKKS